MVDWAHEMGLDISKVSIEAFWHPIAQWENARIAEQGEAYWAWYRHAHPEEPARMARMDAPKRPRFEFTERQIQIAIRSMEGK